MTPPKTHIEVSIPFELSRWAVWQREQRTSYETNRAIKAIGTWLILKHETSSGIIQDWNKQRDWIMQICKCSVSVLYTRLQWLKGQGLIAYNRKEIKVCSWETLGRVLNIRITDSLTFQYNIYDEQKIDQWIIATEIQGNKNRQDFSILLKLDKNPELKSCIYAGLIAIGADTKRFDDCNYLLAMMRVAYMQDFIRRSEIHEALLEVRPDNNRSVRGIANAWSCRNAVTVSYWKKILARTNIITIGKLQIKSDMRIRNKHCRVLWLKDSSQTLLCLCDQIEILKPLQGLQFMQDLPERAAA